MYTAHRGMGVPTQPNSRLTDLLDQVRTEFDTERSKVAEYEQNCKFARMFHPVCSKLRYAPFRGFVSSIPLVREAFQSSKLSNLPLRTNYNRAAKHHGIREA